MQILQSYTQFSPASGESVTVAAPVTGGTFPLPAVDASNVALAVTNAGPSAVAVNLGTAATLPALAGMPGLFAVPAGATVLVTGPLASVVGAAIYFAVAPSPGGASLTLQRGTLATLLLAAPA